MNMDISQDINQNKMFLIDRNDGEKKVPFTVLHTSDIIKPYTSFSNQTEDINSLCFDSIYIKQTDRYPLLDIGYSPVEKLKLIKVDQKNINFQLPSFNYSFSIPFFSNSTIFDAKSYFSKEFNTIPQNIHIKYKELQLSDEKYLFDYEETENFPFIISVKEGYQLYYTFFDQFNFICMKDDSTLNDLKDSISTKLILYSGIVFGERIQNFFKTTDQISIEKSIKTLNNLSSKIKIFDFDYALNNDKEKQISLDISLQLDNESKSRTFSISGINSNSTVYLVTCILEKEFQIDRSLFIPYDQNKNKIELNSPISSINQLNFRIFESLRVKIEDKIHIMSYLTTVEDIKQMFNFKENNFGIIINNHFAHSFNEKAFLIRLLNNSDDPNKATEIIIKRPVLPCHIRTFTDIKMCKTQSFIVPDCFDLEKVFSIYLNKNFNSIEISKEIKDDETFNIEYEYQIKEIQKIDIIFIDESDKSSDVSVELKIKEPRVIDLLNTLNNERKGIFYFYKSYYANYEVYFNEQKVQFMQPLSSIPYNKDNKIKIKGFRYQKVKDDDQKTFKIRNFMNDVSIYLKYENISAGDIINIIMKQNDLSGIDVGLFFEYKQLNPNDHPLICRKEKDFFIFNEITESKLISISNGTSLLIPMKFTKDVYHYISDIITGMFDIQNSEGIQFFLSISGNKYKLPRNFNASAIPNNSVISINYEYELSHFLSFRNNGKIEKIELSNIYEPIKNQKSEIQNKLKAYNISLKSMYFSFYNFKFDENKKFSDYNIPETALIHIYSIPESFPIKIKIPEKGENEYIISPFDTVQDIKNLIKMKYGFNEDFELHDEKNSKIKNDDQIKIPEMVITLVCKQIKIQSQGSLGNKEYSLSCILTIKEAISYIATKLKNKNISIFYFNDFNKSYEKVDYSKRLFEIDTKLFVHKLSKIEFLHFDERNVQMNFKESSCISECNTLEWLKDKFISKKILSPSDQFSLFLNKEKLDENKKIGELLDTNENIISIKFKHDKYVKLETPEKSKSQSTRKYRPKIIRLMNSNDKLPSLDHPIVKKISSEGDTIKPKKLELKDIDDDDDIPNVKQREIPMRELITNVISGNVIKEEEEDINDELNPKSSIECTFYSVTNLKGQKYSITSQNIFELLKIESDSFYIFNSKGKIVNINNDNYKSKLKNNEKYYLINYPSILDEKQKLLTSKSSTDEIKDFFKDIKEYLETNWLELQKLLCVLCKLDKTETLKEIFYEKVENNSFIPLKFISKDVLNTKGNVPLFCRKFFLPFLISLNVITGDSKSYLETFKNLFKTEGQLNSPFTPLSIRELFHRQNIESIAIVMIDNNNYGLFYGQSEDDPNQSLIFYPYENKTVNFSFADYFLKTTSSETETINFEDIFFDTNEYELFGKELGHGTFGKLFIAKKNGVDYAAKIIDQKNDFNGKKQKLLMRESMILQKLQHPSIVNFKGINLQSFENMNILQPTIITNYLKKGSLDKIIEKNKILDWSPTKKYILLLGISNAIRYLHKHGIIHRDLKPANVLIDKDDCPQICDFGNSRCFPDALAKSMEIIASGDFGTPLYNAPELLEEFALYGPEIDVYSFSILAYEVISGKQAFESIRNRKYFFFCKKILEGTRPEFDDSFSEKMKILLRKCWSSNPHERPSFEVIFNELSTDFSYSKEKLDVDVIQKYIKKIQKVPDSPSQVIMKSIKINIDDIENIFFETKDYNITSKLIEQNDFSTIYLAHNQDDNKKYFAQIINVDNFKGHDQMILIRESILLQKLSHPFIVKFIGLNFQSFKNSSEIKPTIITEFLSNGFLSKFIQSENKDILTDSQKAIILLGIANAMKFIHKNGIIHGFLSLNNILLDDDFYPRIRFPYSFSDHFQRESLIKYGFKGYLAPEILDSNKDFGSEIDVYSFAILASEIITDRNAYLDSKRKSASTINSDIRQNLPKNLPSELKNLISECLNENASERPSFEYIYDTLFKLFSDFEKISNDIESFIEKLNE